MRAFLDPRIKGGVRWLHINLTLVLIVLLASSWAAVGGFLVAKHTTHPFKPITMTQVTNTGYQQGPLPPLTRVVSGPPTRTAYSLGGYTVRMHNQGASFSCVGQTLATSAEIIECERYKRTHPGAKSCPTQWFSSGWFWNPFNGGNFYQGISYSDAYTRWQSFGAAPLSEFYPDGWNAWWLYPSNFTATSYRYRIAYFRQIAAWDVVTIKSYIDAGIPIGVAAPWYSSLTSFAGGPTITQEWGYFQYWHSTTIIGYNAAGVIIQNSFGSGWGNHGRAEFSWNFLTALGGALVAGIPANSLPPFKQVTKPSFPLARWNATVSSYNAHHPKHKHAPVSPYYRKALSRIAADWWHGGLSKKFNGPGAVARWDARNKVMYEHFPGKVIVYEWSRVKSAPLKWTRAGKTIRVNR